MTEELDNKPLPSGEDPQAAPQAPSRTGRDF